MELRITYVSPWFLWRYTHKHRYVQALPVTSYNSNCDDRAWGVWQSFSPRAIVTTCPFKLCRASFARARGERVKIRNRLKQFSICPWDNVSLARRTMKHGRAFTGGRLTLWSARTHFSPSLAVSSLTSRFYRPPGTPVFFSPPFPSAEFTESSFISPEFERIKEARFTFRLDAWKRR